MGEQVHGVRGGGWNFSIIEAGFLAWLPQTERARGKAALQSALVQNVLSSTDLRITSYVKRPGTAAAPFSFTEQTLKGQGH